MANLVAISYDGRDSVASIQRQFRDHLSEKEILKATARSINEVSKRVQGHIRREVRKEFTVNNKYLDRMSYLSKAASSTREGLFSNINFSYRNIPMIGFKHTGGIANKKGVKRPITVTMKKGRAQTFRHAFLSTFRSGHTGIFARGRYSRGKFVYSNTETRSGRTRITELSSASPFTMMSIQPMQEKISNYIERSLPPRLQFFLQQKVDRMRNR